MTTSIEKEAGDAIMNLEKHSAGQQLLIHVMYYLLTF